MSNTVTNQSFFDSKVLGHPAGLFVLFFTEMWERFSFYGMRVLLINFLTMAAIGYNPGWEWVTENAGALFGTYAMLLYLTPILGGIIADKVTGYNWAVIIGAAIMTLGHASMAFETELSLYLGLALLVIGTGFFKPNMTSIISEMYKYTPEKKDGAYTIFYMGVNAGAFFGMMLCGYLAEKVGWSWGFGLAGVFMFLGTLQFWLAKPLFGHIGDVPSKKHEVEIANFEPSKEALAEDAEVNKENPFTFVDKILIAICTIIGLGYAINDPLSLIGGVDLFSWAKISFTKSNGELFLLKGQYTAVLFGLILFVYLIVSRILRYPAVVRDRMFAFIIFAFFTVFFWMSFEQGATSLVLFARDFVDRTLSGGAAVAFNVINTLLTIVPLAIISYVLVLLYKKTYKKIITSNIVLSLTFVLVWGIVLWMLNKEWSSTAYEVTYSAVEKMEKNEETGEEVAVYTPITSGYKSNANDKIVKQTTRLSESAKLNVGDKIPIITKDRDFSSFGYLDSERLATSRQRAKELGRDDGIIQAEVSAVKDSEVEITVSWFSILNSFFIIAFASFFSKWWESKYNPSATVKYGLGLIIMAIGFGALAFGSMGVVAGVKVSMIWLIIAYLFHTLGELCLSPVGLSYVSKLVPARMIAFMFGMWYLAIAIGNKLAAVLGGQIENITKDYSLSTFFLIFTIVPIVAGLLIMALGPVLKKLMHGVK